MTVLKNSSAQLHIKRSINTIELLKINKTLISIVCPNNRQWSDLPENHMFYYDKGNHTLISIQSGTTPKIFCASSIYFYFQLSHCMVL